MNEENFLEVQKFNLITEYQVARVFSWLILQMQPWPMSSKQVGEKNASAVHTYNNLARICCSAFIFITIIYI